MQNGNKKYLCNFIQYSSRSAQYFDDESVQISEKLLYSVKAYSVITTYTQSTYHFCSYTN